MEGISIEKARARLGDYVSDAQSGTPVLITRSGKPAAMLVPLTRLTDADSRLRARARKLAGARNLREHTGENDLDDAYALALGEARNLLAEQDAIIARLAAEGVRP